MSRAIARDKRLFLWDYYDNLDPSAFNVTWSPPLATSKAFGQFNQSAVVDAFLRGKRDGFFVEAGAWDGEYLSNSLFFERERNWTGLLVEPNRAAFGKLVVNGRRKGAAAAANVCLSVHKYPEVMTFDSADVFGGVLGEELL